MKVSRDVMASHHKRIVDAASRSFRLRGFAGSGVADIMSDAGMTHGGFYGHFASKAALTSEACEAALGTTTSRWAALIDESPADALGDILDGYLSDRHRDSPATGCAFAALASEAARDDAAVRRPFSDAVQQRVVLLAKLETGTAAARREKAMLTLAAMVGAMVLARVVDDPNLSDELLDSARSQLGG